MFFGGLISMLVLDVYKFSVGASRFVVGAVHPLAPPCLQVWIQVFWNIMPLRLVNIYHRFGGA
jgi:hypothetical protein